MIGKALPFGVGAAVGAGGNLLLGRRVVTGSRKAFGPAPATIPDAPRPREGATQIEVRAQSAVASASRAITRAASGVAQATAKTAQSAKQALTRRKDTTAPAEVDEQ